MGISYWSAYVVSSELFGCCCLVLALCRRCLAVPVPGHLCVGWLGRAGSRRMNGGEGPSPVMRSAFLGLCPQCGAQTIFGTHIVRFEPRCRGCGLDYSQFNVGDGPAAFLILIVGAIITALALFVRSEEHTSELQSL